MRRRCITYLFIPAFFFVGILLLMPKSDQPDFIAEPWNFEDETPNDPTPPINISKEELKFRQDSVREAYLHAFNSYSKYVYGRDELKPKTHKYRDWLGMGLSILDSIDTMYLMGLTEEYTKARYWIEFNLKFDHHQHISAFETTIRVVGGLISIYQMTGDEMFLNKAKMLGKKLMLVFDTPTGIPYSRISLFTGETHNGWGGRASYLSELGTLQMEFATLSKFTGIEEFGKKALRVYDILESMEKPDGLYSIWVDPRTATFQSAKYWLESKWNNLFIDNTGKITMGGLGDSFYEYLVKMWILTGKSNEQYKRMYNSAMDAVIKHLAKKSSPNGYAFLAMKVAGKTINTMDHLACFAGGMFALGAYHNITENANVHMKFAEQLTLTCRESYARQETGLGPDAIDFTAENDFTFEAKNFVLRPETIESYYVLWWITGNQKYQQWAWEAFLAIETYCRTPDGYCGVNDVTTKRAPRDNLQQSYFLAETLKYLYLIFSPRDLVSLDRWVFNTEAHPFLVWDT